MPTKNAKKFTLSVDKIIFVWYTLSEQSKGDVKNDLQSIAESCKN